MFRKAICGFIAAWLVTSAAQAVVVTFQDTTASGNSAAVRDNYMRQDGAADTNGGLAVGDVRAYPDVGFASGKGPRHLQIWFDVSSIPAGSIINSATYGMRFIRNGASAPAITGFKLSRFNSGKDWIEGTHVTDTVSAGEPTWNSQKHGTTLWSTPGATGAADIDLGTTITWDKTAALTETVLRTEASLAGWVQGWVNTPADNNGMLMWGGVGPGGANNYHLFVVSEDADIANRPFLTIDYTEVPEPATGLFLVAGLLPMLLRRKRGA